ncbi:MAG: class I SAM-dependent methyltransferase [Xanthomonadales bacterium]|nr:class I SAM-dependent methyltransferase [Xanthomonadales bacterium]
MKNQDFKDRDFKDHFSGHAEDYARYRPGYPPCLFDWLAGQAPAGNLAWDVGTGNGQVARVLARHLARVHATDASPQQLARAEGPANVRFVVEPAERCSLAIGEVDLVTVGQALHWFDLERFYPEVQRVLKPGGLFAAWTYQLNEITPDVDGIVDAFYENVVGPYWPPERVHVEQGYEDLPFPFTELDAPAFSLETRWTLEEYLGYIGTWSALRRYRAQVGEDPLPDLRKRLESVWGEAEAVQAVRWPLALRVGRKS